jgi:hypothetical protein
MPSPVARIQRQARRHGYQRPGCGRGGSAGGRGGFGYGGGFGLVAISLPFHPRCTVRASGNGMSTVMASGLSLISVLHRFSRGRERWRSSELRRRRVKLPAEPSSRQSSIGAWKESHSE